MTNIAFLILGLSFLLQSIQLMREKCVKPFAGWLLLPAPVFMTAEIIRRTILIRHPALTGSYEVLTFFSALLLLAAAIRIIRISQTPWIEFGICLLVIFLLAFASSPLVPRSLHPPVPALRSSWLVLHVSLAFLGEAFFAFSFITAIGRVMTIDSEKKESCDRLTRKAVSIGYPIYTIGALLFGAVWAKHAWGRYWGWDPKELWAFVTFLVYTAYILITIVFKKRNIIGAWISIIGFLTAMFTFLGVNFLIKSLHSYR